MMDLCASAAPGASRPNRTRLSIVRTGPRRRRGKLPKSASPPRSSNSTRCRNSKPGSITTWRKPGASRPPCATTPPPTNTYLSSGTRHLPASGLNCGRCSLTQTRSSSTPVAVRRWRRVTCSSYSPACMAPITCQIAVICATNQPRSRFPKASARLSAPSVCRILNKQT